MSNTSDVHSSLTTVCTHLAKSSSPCTTAGLPVNISNRMIPKLYTSFLCQVSATAAWEPELKDEEGGDGETSSSRPKSEMHALPSPSTRTLEEVRCWWESLELDVPWRYARPLAAPSASCSLEVHSNGILPGPRFPAAQYKI